MNIYIADDHALFRSGLKYLLTGLDNALNIQEAGTVQELRNQNLTNFDLVLVDLKFDDFDALYILPEIIEQAGAARIVVVSGDDRPERVRKCIDAGAMGFLPKSEDQAKLLPALRLVLAGGIYLPARAILEYSLGQAPAPQTHRIKKLLSERQWEILQQAIIGTPNKGIARRLEIAEGTVKAHLSKIYHVIGVKNRTEAVYVFAQETKTSVERDPS
jgi:two-component system, NarL family, nitrate/nitrite response regulator NarL